MSEWRRVLPEFWDGDTGITLRSMGPGVQLTALYLLTAPHSHQSGLYKLSFGSIAEHTGCLRNPPDEESTVTFSMGIDGAKANLQSLIEIGFAKYDSDQQLVYIPTMARFQIGTELKPADKRIPGLKSHLLKFRKSAFLAEFLDTYGEAYRLEDLRGGTARSSPSKGMADDLTCPSRGLTVDGDKQKQLTETQSQTEEPSSSFVSESVDNLCDGESNNEVQLKTVPVQGPLQYPAQLSTSQSASSKQKTPASVTQAHGRSDALELARHLENLRGNPGSNLNTDSRILAPILESCDLETGKKILTGIKADQDQYWWIAILKSGPRLIVNKFPEFQVTYNALKSRAAPVATPARGLGSAGAVDTNAQRARMRMERLAKEASDSPATHLAPAATITGATTLTTTTT
jgi:hypothetical protein